MNLSDRASGQERRRSVVPLDLVKEDIGEGGDGAGSLGGWLLACWVA